MHGRVNETRLLFHCFRSYAGRMGLGAATELYVGVGWRRTEGGARAVRNLSAAAVDPGL